MRIVCFSQVRSQSSVALIVAVVVLDVILKVLSKGNLCLWEALVPAIMHWHAKISSIRPMPCSPLSEPTFKARIVRTNYVSKKGAVQHMCCPHCLWCWTRSSAPRISCTTRNPRQNHDHRCMPAGGNAPIGGRMPPGGGMLGGGIPASPVHCSALSVLVATRSKFRKTLRASPRAGAGNTHSWCYTRNSQITHHARYDVNGPEAHTMHISALTR